eukprot:CAMPEP_0168322126 /NCGR_PEP_ID=MMETSP0213-20121227/2693_1 /TAXON_ID=151035 /ORGANISM="Euplotes harpa, Strain FSP1.4" /LENGTH=87 /DNA_ID=CAMNT_0008323933 /DNA_START=698 /DNA_END=961 /DNA_ORIENTATION=+
MIVINNVSFSSSLYAMPMVYLVVLNGGVAFIMIYLSMLTTIIRMVKKKLFKEKSVHAKLSSSSKTRKIVINYSESVRSFANQSFSDK